MSKRKIFTQSLVHFYVFRSAAARSKRSKMPNQPIKVYYYPVSPPCRAVLLTARLLGLKVELVLINIMEGEQKSPEFIKVSLTNGELRYLHYKVWCWDEIFVCSITIP